MGWPHGRFVLKKLVDNGLPFGIRDIVERVSHVVQTAALYFAHLCEQPRRRLGIEAIEQNRGFA